MVQQCRCVRQKVGQKLKNMNIMIDEKTNMRARRKRRNAGFTLVEMVVVITVLSILLALSVGGMLAWQDWADFNRQNEYAQTIFIAAQNQMTEYSANGKLDALCEELPSGSAARTVSLSSLKDEDGNAYSESSVWYESADKSASAQSKYRGTLQYARCAKGDYRRYLDGTLGSDAHAKEAELVFSLLSSYIYDGEILNAAISIEFTPEEGQIFAVCYSDKNNSFTYKSSEVNAEEAVVDISNREVSYRKNSMIGFYGVDTLARSTTSKQLKPTLSNVKLNNEDTLNLSFRVTKAAGAAQSMSYEVSVYDAETDALSLSILLDGTKLHNYENRSVITCSVTRYVSTASSVGEASADAETGTVGVTADYKMLAWIDADETVRLVLDAADLQATAEDYKNALATYGAADISASSFATTYSFHRFGLDSENIYCTLQGTGTNYKSTAKKRSNSSSAYFGESTVTATPVLGNSTLLDYELNYTIQNARHLYNVRYVEDLSTAEQIEYCETYADAQSIRASFRVKEDVDWGAFAQSGALYFSKDDNSTIKKLPETISVQEIPCLDGTSVYCVNSSDFPSYKELRMDDSFDGEQHTISQLTMSRGNNMLFGVYGSDADAFGAVAQSDVDDRPVGLFVRNYGTLMDLQLDRITVTGYNRVGAFCGVNIGVVSGLTTLNSDNTSVITGNSYVGGVIGDQLGATYAGKTVQELPELAESGLPSSAVVVSLEDLTNKAKVLGKENIGGIVGKAKVSSDADLYMQIKNCENTGVVGVADSVTNRADARYIGGIVGYCENAYQGSDGEIDAARLQLVSCVSSAQYSESDLDTLLERSKNDSRDAMEFVTDDGYRGTYLKGVYVGGIVGYNSYATIVKCNTNAQDGKTGYVFGYKYVGGIVGFNQGPASGIDGNAADDAADDVKKSVNASNVVGVQYVGGITGCNSSALVSANGTDLELDDEGIIQPDNTVCLNVKVSNWVNKGVVYAKDAYAGGITGYNSGWLFACNSEVENTETSGFFQETYSGDYAGGIAGYNNGVIGNTKRTVDAEDSSKSVITDAQGKRISAICYITGTNYVGGIVGYNDVDATVEDYEIAGGKIQGSGNYVGGYAGVNVSLRLLVNDNNTPHVIVSKPDVVKGAYFVGGSIGANIVNCTSFDNGQTNLNTVFETNNFFGRITAEAFAGGFVGYNLLLKDDADNKKAGQIVSGILEQFDKIDAGDYALTTLSDGDAAGSDETLIAKTEVLDNLASKLDITIHYPSAKMIISGEQEGQTQNKLGLITGKIYLGGVMGYCDANTRLVIKNVTNTTPVTATAAIVNANEQKNRANKTDALGTKVLDTQYDGATFTYSYAGGIIGRVGARVTLIQCSNRAGARVTTAGTYTGGLTEVNAGTIQSCEVSSVGSSGDDYIGGICGLNLSGATITDCIMDGKTISGRNYVGGIAAENFGTIANSKITNQAAVKAVGIDVKVTNDGASTTEKQGIAGCIAAYNAGTIRQKQDLDVSVETSGKYAGAVSGINSGSIVNAKTSGKIVITGTVNGDSDVGGVIGINRGKTSVSSSADNVVSGYRNESKVRAVNGNAGGIIGNNAVESTIRDCENAAQVRATRSGNAGGITAANDALIEACVNTAEVSAPNGSCGGITAENGANGRIISCEVRLAGADVDGPGALVTLLANQLDARLTLTSQQAVGGIAAYNAGTICNPVVVGVAVYNYTNSAQSNIGVVVGENQAGATITLDAGYAVIGCLAQTYSDNSNVGGVAGYNQGTITAPDWYQEVTLTAGEEDLSQRAFDVPKAWVSCAVSYRNNAATVGNLGGVAGKNEGLVENIGVTDASIVGNIGTTATGTGGVVGMSGYSETANRTKAQVKNCTFDGTVKANGTTANTIYLGGIAGLNNYDSEIYGCRIGVQKETLVDGGTAADTSNYGYVGGIAGTSYGSVVACDNYHTDATSVSVTVRCYMGQIGGVVGVAQETAVVTGEQNRRLSSGTDWLVTYAHYQNDHAIGGIVGTMRSNEACRYASNYAEASYRSDETPTYNMARAGIVGRIMAASTNSILFEYCYNYGDITSIRTSTGTYWTGDNIGRAGGIIGQLQYSGVTIQNCKNYGDMRGNHYTGGMIGCIYRGSTDVELLHCENHGNLYGTSRAGGMIAMLYNSSGTKYNIIMDDCVNTGLIGNSNSSANRAGMGVMNYGAASDATAYFNLCQNYGYAPSGTATNFSGIHTSVAVNTIRNSFDMSRGRFASTTALNQSGNYYLNVNSWSGTGTASSAGAARLNYKNAGLYMDSTPTTVQDLVTLPQSAALYYTLQSETTDKKANSYKLGQSVSEQNIRYQTFVELHDKVIAFTKSQYCALNVTGAQKLDEPDGLDYTYNSNAGYYLLQWNSVEQAYSYEIRYTLTMADGSVKEDTKEVIGLCRAKFTTEELASASQIAISIRAKDGCDGDAHASDWVTLDTSVKTKLPTPQYHFEMTPNGKMVAIIDNASDYIAADGTVLANIKLSGHRTYTVNPAVGYSDNLIQAFSTGQYTLQAYAEAVDSTHYENSPRTYIISHVAGSTVLSSQLNGISYEGFYGDSPSDLEYHLTLKTAGSSTSYYYNQEIMAYDEELGTDVSYAHGTAQITMDSDVSVVLGGFPTDITKKSTITVRNVFWKVQGNTVFYGHVVKEGLTAEAVKTLKDTAYYSVSGESATSCKKTTRDVFNGDELNPGYLIYKNADGTYTVYYSTLLERKLTNRSSKSLVDKVYTRSGDETAELEGKAQYTSGSESILLQPAPQIDETYQQSDTEYVFTWDSGKDAAQYQDASYSVELIGQTIDDKTVSLDTVYEVSWDAAKGCASYSVTPESNWDYKSLVLEVTRRGDVDSKNKAVTLPNTASETFAIQIPLSQISAPEVSHETDDENNSNMDEMRFQITWSGVSQASEQADLAGYLITVSGRDTDGLTPTPAHYYYVLEPGVDHVKTIEQLKTSANESVVNVTAEYDRSNLSALCTVVDLSDFQYEENICVSIQALAKDAADVYRDGSSGVEQYTQLPPRLSVADVANLKANYDIRASYQADDLEQTDVDARAQVIVASQLDDDGIVLSIQNALANVEDENASQNKIGIAVAVYDELPENTDFSDTSKAGRSGDGADDAVQGCWNYGASETLLKKSDKTTMTGNAVSATIRLATPKDGWAAYAGKWLKVALRTTSNNAISSWWSDEDAAKAATLNYQWIRIPYVQLDTAQVKVQSAANTKPWYYNDNDEWDTDEDEGISIRQRSLLLTPDAYADGYRIELLAAQSSDSQQAVMLTLQKAANGGYTVYYAATGEHLANADGKVETSDNLDNPYTKKLGVVKVGETMDLPYTMQASFSGVSGAVNTAVTATVASHLTVNEDGTVLLELPDIIQIKDANNNYQKPESGYYMTKQVAIQAYSLAQDGETVAFTDAKISKITLSANGDSAVDTVDVRAETETPDTSDLELSELEEQTYQLMMETQTDMIVRVISSQNDKLQSVLYEMMPLSKTTSDDDKSQAVLKLPADLFDDDAEVSASFAQIGSDGISAWSAPVTLSKPQHAKQSGDGEE